MTTITKVTMTGADDSTKATDLLELSQKYKFVEWGILTHSYVTDNNKVSRFASLRWLEEELKPVVFNANFENIPFNLSLHVCGKYVRDICQGETKQFLSVFKDKLSWFNRVQLNCHGQFHEVDKVALLGALVEIRKISNVTFIFQLDDVNNEIFEYVLDNKIPAVPLYDISSGAGILPENWPELNYDCELGYAGGLGPANLEKQIPQILKASEGKSIWIDAETLVRSDDDAIFDLDKVDAFLKYFADLKEAKVNGNQ